LLCHKAVNPGSEEIISSENATGVIKADNAKKIRGIEPFIVMVRFINAMVLPYPEWCKKANME
jgi:hypothetical protein